MKRKGFALVAASFFVLVWSAPSWAPTERELPNLKPVVSLKPVYAMFDEIYNMGDDANVTFLMKAQGVRKQEVLAVVKAFAAKEGMSYESAVSYAGSSCVGWVLDRGLAKVRADGDTGAARMKCVTHNTLQLLDAEYVAQMVRDRAELRREVQG